VSTRGAANDDNDEGMMDPSGWKLGYSDFGFAGSEVSARRQIYDSTDGKASTSNENNSRY
jgi:hypothetical protein